MHKLPVFVRAGAIMPMQPATPHTGQKPEQLIVHVYAGPTANDFLFYEDDGATFDYQKKVFAKRTIEYKPSERKIVFRAAEGSYHTSYKTTRLVLHGFDTAITTAKVNKEVRSVIPEVNRFFAGLEKFDPIHDPEPAPEEPVQVIEFDYHGKEIVVQW